MIEKFERAKGCKFTFCKNYPILENGELVVNPMCKMCINFIPFNLLEKEDGNTKNSKDQNKK